MLFNSLEFLLFFPIVTVLYFLLPHRFRWLHLLVASCIFYMAFVPVYILILFVTIIIDYIAGILIEKAAGHKRKWLLVLSIVVNVGMLAVFKYYNFFVENTAAFCALIHIKANIPLLKMALPIGLSFHTFQAMSYTIEVYRGHQKAERHLGIYALYVMFYPQLVAGPIERPQNLLHQFHEQHYFNYDNVTSGLRLMLWGLFKKLIIADRLSVVVDMIFNNPHQYSGVAFLIGAIFFSFQIFCDFSGYSDIAIGAAKVMGFHLMTNFNAPYHSRSVSEFWKRWHISLSTWFKDYLYISLGGNRVSVPRMYFNLFFVFLVSGFWHGANWTFIAWGAIHGFYLVFALFTKEVRYKMTMATGIGRIPWLRDAVNVATTFFLAMMAWIFFRANKISDAFFIVKKIGAIPFGKAGSASLGMANLHNRILPCFLVIAILEIAHLIQVRFRLRETFTTFPVAARWALYFSGIGAIFCYGIHPPHSFIYFQF